MRQSHNILHTCFWGECPCLLKVSVKSVEEKQNGRIFIFCQKWQKIGQNLKSVRFCWKFLPGGIFASWVTWWHQNIRKIAKMYCFDGKNSPGTNSPCVIWPKEKYFATFRRFWCHHVTQDAKIPQEEIFSKIEHTW